MKKKLLSLVIIFAMFSSIPFAAKAAEVITNINAYRWASHAKSINVYSNKTLTTKVGEWRVGTTIWIVKKIEIPALQRRAGIFDLCVRHDINLIVRECKQGQDT